MLTVSQLSKFFAGRALFDDVSLQVNRGDRIGLVGPNGDGKSTLFTLLLGDVSPDNGTIAIGKNPTHRYTHALPPSIETSRPFAHGVRTAPAILAVPAHAKCARNRRCYPIAAS